MFFPILASHTVSGDTPWRLNGVTFPGVFYCAYPPPCQVRFFILLFFKLVGGWVAKLSIDDAGWLGQVLTQYIKQFLSSFIFWPFRLIFSLVETRLQSLSACPEAFLPNRLG